MCSSGGSITELVAVVESALAELASLDVAGLADDEVHAALSRLLAVGNQLSAVTSAVVGSFDVRQLSEVDGFRATRSWLESFGRMSQGAASGWLKRARLQRQLPALASAAGRGSVSSEQLGVVGKLADHVGLERVVPFDEVLAELAAAAGPAEVAHACRRIHAHLDPDGPDPDPHGAFERRELTLSRCGSMMYLRGRFDLEGGAVLATALDAMMRPPDPDDSRTAPQRRADAAVELGRQALARGEVPTVGGVRPQVGLLVTPSILLNGAKAAGGDPHGDSHLSDSPLGDSSRADPPCADPPRADLSRADPPRADLSRADPPRADLSRADPLDRMGVPQLPELPWAHWVGEIPPELAQRLSCDCEVWRAILDPATGLPLEVGRAHRLVPSWMRKALQARDRGCRWPGCTAPAAWTDAHHLVPWYLGGRTDVDSLLLLCRFHHVKVHEGHWRLELDRTTGEVRIYRPDGRAYELGPSRAWASPGRHASGPSSEHNGPA